MRDKTFDEVLNNVFNELVLLEKELIKRKDQVTELVSQINTVRCTGPNQKEVLAKLYAIADAISEEQTK